MADGRRASLRPWLVSGSLACLAVLLTLVVLVFPTIRTPQQAAADAAPPPPSPITAKVEKRPLSDDIVLRAVVAPGGSIDLKPSDALIAASPVVTGLPAAGAANVQPGTVLIEANGEPIIAMNWPFPAYRDIRGGDSGPDVLQLQKTLATLGYPASQTGTFDAATRLGVVRLYTDRGYTAPKASGATLSDGPGNVVGATGASNAPQKTLISDQAVSGQVYLPARDVQTIPAPSSRITSIPVQVGQKLGTADLVLAKLDGKASTVIAATTTDRAGRIAVGNTGTLTAGIPGQQYPVMVTGVASSAEDVPGLGQGIRVDLEFVDPAKAAPVSPNQTTSKLEVTTGAGSAVGIVLPITAIYSTQDGASYVIPASDPREHITVDLGENVDGWVAIKGDSALKEGEEVILGMQRGG